MCVAGVPKEWFYQEEESRKPNWWWARKEFP